MSNEFTHEQLTVAAATIAQANAALQDARLQVEAARRVETTAINALNEAQKRFDALVVDLKKEAPRESDWGRRKTVGPAEC